MKIREAAESDAQGMVDLFCKLDSETKFLMMELGERKISVESQAKRIESFGHCPDQLMAVSLVEDAVVGFIAASCGTANRNRHSAYMVIGVEKAHWGKGIGKCLIQYMENWARSVSVHRIELTVVESNVAARSLYKRCGYVEEGIKTDSLKVDGIYVNEIYMSKLF